MDDSALHAFQKFFWTEYWFHESIKEKEIKINEELPLKKKLEEEIDLLKDEKVQNYRGKTSNDALFIFFCLQNLFYK